MSHGSLGWTVVGAKLIDHRGMGQRGTWRVFGAHALMVLLRGRGEYRDRDGARNPLGAGDIVWVTPWASHWYGPDDGTTWDEQFVVFDGPILDAWAKSAYRPSPPIFVTGEPTLWGRRLESLSALKDELDQVLGIQKILSELCRQVGPALVEGPTWLVEAKKLLGEVDAEAPSLESVAEALEMPYETFRKRFQAEVGCGPGSFREQRRTEAAANLLRYTNFGHAEVASRLGYGNEYYFSRRFKHMTGITPSAFRKREQGPLQEQR